MLVTAAIYFGGIIIDWAFSVREIFLPAIPYSIIAMIVFFAVSTVLFSVTVSLIIVNFTKNKIDAFKETSAVEIKPAEANKYKSEI